MWVGIVAAIFGFIGGMGLGVAFMVIEEIIRLEERLADGRAAA